MKPKMRSQIVGGAKLKDDEGGVSLAATEVVRCNVYLNYTFDCETIHL